MRRIGRIVSVARAGEIRRCFFFDFFFFGRCGRFFRLRCVLFFDKLVESGNFFHRKVGFGRRDYRLFAFDGRTLLDLVFRKKEQRSCLVSSAVRASGCRGRIYRSARRANVGFTVDVVFVDLRIRVGVVFGIGLECRRHLLQKFHVFGGPFR